VGEQVDVDPDALATALRARLPGVEVRMLAVPAVLHCLDCGAEYPADEFPCPVCGSNRAELLHGGELAIRRAWTQ
jgi:Zn finger protein HypA/HybF involved in hydrogenase expression